MRASKKLRNSNNLLVRALPPLDEVQRSVDSVIEKWPDAVTSPHSDERDKIAQDMLRRVLEWDWHDINTQRTTSAAVAVFDADRCTRYDLTPVREFFQAEIIASPSGAFLDAMVGVYIDSFSLDSEHTLLMARALAMRINDFGYANSKLIADVPDLLKPASAPQALAAIMLKSEDPFQAMKDLGLRSPHNSGLMQATHPIFIKSIARKLGNSEERQRLFNWLTPKAGMTLETGATSAIEALLAIWKDSSPTEEIRQDLSEKIVAAYNDPRLNRGGIWSGFDPSLKQILLRWLTRQHMKYFCDMVTATQSSHMWGPRRDFWLQLDEDKRIDEAWVAFGTSATQYAQQIQGLQFGRQLDRGGSTSLLIMRIGNKIVVDGCHSYKTHIFRYDDPKAPKLYQSHYHCDRIMRNAKNSKPHSSIPVWKQWVEQHV